MTVTYVSFNQSTAEFLDGADQLFVLARITGNGLAAAIDVSGNNNDVFIEGTVSNGDGRGVLIEGSVNSLTVSATGSIFQASPFGGSAVFLDDGGGFHDVLNYGEIIGNYGIATGGTSNNNTIVNHGTITSTEDTSGIGGVTFFTDTNDLTNTGTVTGAFAGVLTRSGADFNSIVNEGTLTGSTAGVSIQGLSNDLINNGSVIGGTGVTSIGNGFQLTNYGDIIGTDGTGVSISAERNEISNFGSILGNVNAASIEGTRVANEGLIDGDLNFFGGDNTYAAAEAGRVTGSVIGDAGNDQMTGGSSEDRFDGGTGDDTLRGKDGDDDLTGGGGRDTIRGNKGDDAIDGNGSADSIAGGWGDDNLDGGGGGDTLTGGRGDDTMTGGSGADIFVFGRTTDKDVITDFADGEDVIDLSRLDAAKFNALANAGAIYENGKSGTVLDLRLIGGEGIVTIATMELADWDKTDFLF